MRRAVVQPLVVVPTLDGPQRELQPATADQLAEMKGGLEALARIAAANEAAIRLAGLRVRDVGHIPSNGYGHCCALGVRPAAALDLVGLVVPAVLVGGPTPRRATDHLT